MKPTIYDVAREAGVSIATVSKILNGKGKISPSTKRRVLEVIERLGYQPNLLASALTGKRTYTFGLLIPDVANPFFAEVARSVEDRGQALGFTVILCSTDNRDDRLARYLAVLRQKRVDGLIIGTGVDDPRLLAALKEEGLPFTLIARDLPSLPVTSVRVDDFVGGYLAAQHLLELGHRKMVVLTESMTVMSSQERVRGFRQALEEAGVAFADVAVHTCAARVDEGRRKALKVLDAADRPTAIFAGNDLIAIGVLQAAKEKGMTVPDDLSVVGFDNTVLGTICDPPLTTVAQPIEEMGKQVVDLLLRELGGEAEVKQRVILRPELIVRASTAPPRQ